MNEFFEKIKNDYPWSKLNKYWSHLELFLKKDSEKWWIKISGTKEQVKNTVNFIINLEKNEKI